MSITRIQPFSPSTDDVESWTLVLQNFLLATGVDKSKDTEKAKAAAIFLSSVGVSNYALIKDLVSPTLPESMSFDALSKVLIEHYKPKPKAISERYKFFNRKQQPGESVTVYLSELRKLAVTCKFENLDVSLRDQFVVGLSSEAAQKRLFIEDDTLTLVKAVAIATGQESADASTRLIRQQSQVTYSSTDPVFKVQRNFNSQHMSQSRQSSSTSSSEKPCPRCGNSFHYKECPALKVKCHSCGKVGHFAQYCQSQSPEESKGEGSTCYKIHTVTVNQGVPPILVNVKLNQSVKVQMELDTGSGRSFISPSVWVLLGSPALEPCQDMFSTYTGKTFQAEGQFTCLIEHNGQSVSHKLLVSKNSSVFGRDLLRKLEVDWSKIEKKCQVKSVGQHVKVKSVRPVQTLDSSSKEEVNVKSVSQPVKSVRQKVKSVSHPVNVRPIQTLDSLQRKNTSQSHVVEGNPLTSKEVCLVTSGTKSVIETIGVKSSVKNKSQKARLDSTCPDPCHRQSKANKAKKSQLSETCQFKMDQSVWFRPFSRSQPSWIPGKVVAVLGPVRYVIKAEGRTYNRHVNNILEGELLQRNRHMSTPLDEDEVIKPDKSPAETTRHRHRQPPEVKVKGEGMQCLQYTCMH